MVVKKSVNVLKNKKKRHSCSSPLYILYTDNKQSSQACINSKTMINEGKQANIKHTRRDIFGKAGIKVTRSVICDLILILFFFFFVSQHCPIDWLWLSFTVTWCHSGCHRELKCISWAVCRQCCCSAGWTGADNERSST